MLSTATGLHHEDSGADGTVTTDLGSVVLSRSMLAGLASNALKPRGAQRLFDGDDWASRLKIRTFWADTRNAARTHVKKHLRALRAYVQQLSDAWENATVGHHPRIKCRVLRLGYRRVSRRVPDEIPVEVEQCRQARQGGIAPLKEELRLTRGSRPVSGRPSIRRTVSRSSTRRQRSTRPGDLCSVPCSSIMCVYIWRYGASTSLCNTQPVVVPSVPGSSGSPRLISCKVVPSCRNEGRFAQGPRRSLLQNPPANPKCAGQEQRLSATWTFVATTSPRRRGRKSQMGCGHTRHVALDVMPPANGTTQSVVPRGCRLEICKCYPRSARRAVGDVLWLPPLPSVPLLTALPTVVLIAVAYQDLRHVSFPLGGGPLGPTETRENLSIWNYGQGAADMDTPCSFISGESHSICV